MAAMHNPAAIVDLAGPSGVFFVFSNPSAPAIALVDEEFCSLGFLCARCHNLQLGAILGANMGANMGANLQHVSIVENRR